MMFLRIERTDDLDWEGLAFVLVLTAPLTEHSLDRLRQLILAWYTMGVYSAWEDGCPNFISDISYSVNEGKYHVEWWVDMGSLRPFALDVFTNSLARWVEIEGLQVEKLLIGWQYIK